MGRFLFIACKNSQLTALLSRCQGEKKTPKNPPKKPQNTKQQQKQKQQQKTVCIHETVKSHHLQSKCKQKVAGYSVSSLYATMSLFSECQLAVFWRGGFDFTLINHYTKHSS